MVEKIRGISSIISPQKCFLTYLFDIFLAKKKRGTDSQIYTSVKSIPQIDQNISQKMAENKLSF
jgi:hypothetical protein